MLHWSMKKKMISKCSNSSTVFLLGLTCSVCLFWELSSYEFDKQPDELIFKLKSVSQTCSSGSSGVGCRGDITISHQEGVGSWQSRTCGSICTSSGCTYNDLLDF